MKTKPDIYQYILGGVIVLVLIAVMYLLFTIEIPETNKTLLILMVGTLLSAFTTVVQYHYGSSKGSAEKDDLLRKKDE